MIARPRISTPALAILSLAAVLALTWGWALLELGLWLVRHL